jgi:2-polyprenyl-6-methoxyphenol hydroxylase-like FAD-dependent oxidoreductase
MPPSILIIGCSVAGPTLASFLLLSPNIPAESLPHITILERAPSVRVQGQNIDIRGTGIAIIRKLGIESTIRAHLTGEEGTEFVDDDGKVWARNAVDRREGANSATADIEIRRGQLARICYERCKTVSEQVQSQGGHGVEFIFGDYLGDIQQNGDSVTVHFANANKTRNFDIVVGADGLQSSVRQLVWGGEGEEERLNRLGMYGGFFSIPRSSTDTNFRRWWRGSGRRWIMLRPSEDPMRTTVFMSVINEQDERLPKVAKLGRNGLAEQKKLLAEYFDTDAWECRRVVEEMMKTEDFYYDMVAQVKMEEEKEQWFKGRVVLLGDAGYVLPTKSRLT